MGDSSNDGYDKNETFHLCRSQSSSNNKNKLIIGYTGVGSGVDKSCLLPRYLQSPSYVSKNDGDGFKVIDREYCGTILVRCKTINYIDNTIDPTHDYIININSGEYEEWKLTSRNSTIRDLRGNSKESTIITIINKDEFTNPIFYIPSTCLHSTLIISSITFIINTKYLMISNRDERY
jgi:hypothetical protein